MRSALLNLTLLCFGFLSQAQQIFVDTSESPQQLIEERPDEYYSGYYWIMWTNYGGNEHLDCFTDYTTGLDKYFDVSKLTNEWEDEYNKFRLGLI